MSYSLLEKLVRFISTESYFETQQDLLFRLTKSYYYSQDSKIYNDRLLESEYDDLITRLKHWDEAELAGWVIFLKDDERILLNRQDSEVSHPSEYGSDTSSEIAVQDSENMEGPDSENMEGPDSENMEGGDDIVSDSENNDETTSENGKDFSEEIYERTVSWKVDKEMLMEIAANMPEGKRSVITPLYEELFSDKQEITEDIVTKCYNKSKDQDKFTVKLRNYLFLIKLLLDRVSRESFDPTHLENKVQMSLNCLNADKLSPQCKDKSIFLDMEAYPSWITLEEKLEQVTYVTLGEISKCSTDYLESILRMRFYIIDNLPRKSEYRLLKLQPTGKHCFIDENGKFISGENWYHNGRLYLNNFTTARFYKEKTIQLSLNSVIILEEIRDRLVHENSKNNLLFPRITSTVEWHAACQNDAEDLFQFNQTEYDVARIFRSIYLLQCHKEGSLLDFSAKVEVAEAMGHSYDEQQDCINMISRKRKFDNID